MKKNRFSFTLVLLLALIFSTIACEKTYTLGPLQIPTATPVPQPPTMTKTSTLSPTRTWTPTFTVTLTSTKTKTPTPVPGVPPINIYCSSETGSVTGTGRYPIDYATAMVPLCDGWILYGDLTNNKIQAVNVLYGSVGANYQLSAVPGDMAYDPTTGFLYVILTGASFLAKVDLNTGIVTNIALPGQAAHLTVASNGFMFVGLSTAYSSPTQYFCYINGNTNTILSTFSMGTLGFDPYLACSSAGTTLYVGADGCSGCQTYQFAFNTTTYALTTQYSLYGYTSNGEEMSLSPDQNHLVWVNGGGNGAGYTIYDIFSTNINSTYGSFNTGAYPRSAGFSPDSANIATTNGSDLQVFSVYSHTASKATWVGASAGSGGSPYNIYDLLQTCFSKGGGYVYGLDAPTYTTPANSAIVWETFP